MMILVASPHRDDAALSCAIAIQRLALSEKVTVANFFTVSEYAPFRTSEPGSVTEVRLREDQAFAKVAHVALQDLHLLDAPQRLSIEMSEISTTRPLDSGDEEPRDAITRHIVDLRPDLVFVPLALGDHIDHRIAQRAAVMSGSTALCFYEDLPYAARLPVEAPEQRAESLELRLAPWVTINENAKEWKAACAALYPSQIDSATVTEIAAFSDRYAGGERYWITPQAATFLAQYAR